MAKKTHEEKLAAAIQRLETHGDMLIYRGRGSYGGSIRSDLRLVLDHLKWLDERLADVG